MTMVLGVVVGVSCGLKGFELGRVRFLMVMAKTREDRMAVKEAEQRWLLEKVRGLGFFLEEI